MDETVKSLALSAGYSDADIAAGWEFYRRKHRLAHPPGKFDAAKRFFAEERTKKVRDARRPSRAFPLSEMGAARTSEHCAELFEAVPLHVRRIAKALDAVAAQDITAHEHIEQVDQAARILKKVTAPRDA
jgi:hypothetical protein